MKRGRQPVHLCDFSCCSHHGRGNCCCDCVRVGRAATLAGI